MLAFLTVMSSGVSVSQSNGFLTFPLAGTDQSLYHGWYYSKNSLHKAIDIREPADTEVLAAAPGWAISSCQPYHAGGNDTFGLFVLIHHDNGYSTLYAHLNSTLLPTQSRLPCDNASRYSIETSSSNIVYLGQSYPWTRVDRGTPIGKVGKSGTTYYHLHFQVAQDSLGAYCKNAKGSCDARVDPYTLYSTAEVYPPPASRCNNVVSSQYLWTQCPPLPSTTTTNQRPIGSLDGINSADQVFGWAQDSDSPTAPVAVHLYIDKNAGNGGSPIAVIADQFRSGVGSHAFNWNIPASLKDGQTHTVWAWGIDSTDPTANNALLPGSPKTFNISPSSPPPTAGFLMSANGPGVLNGQNPLNITVAQGDVATVSFDASPSTPSDAIKSWVWTVKNPDGTTAIIGTTKTFYAYFPVGAYSISLVVTDGAGSKSSPATGTINVVANTVSQSFDAVADFSITANPNTVWSYGYTTTLGGPLVLHGVNRIDYFPGVDRWASPSVEPNIGVMHNKTSSPITGSPGTYSIPPDMLQMHPGQGGLYDVVRWTAPQSGQYSVQGMFAGLDVNTGVADTDVHVLLNSATELINGAVLHGVGTSLPFAFTTNVNAGAVIDFVVGVGPSKAWQNDSTGLKVTIVNPTARSFTEAFDNAPDYSNNWTIAWQSGSSTVTYTPGNFRIQAPPVCTGPTSGSGIGFRSKQSFSGNIDATFQLYHGGFGRTQVGLWSATQNQGVIWSILDTDDTNYLDFVSGPYATEWKYAGSPYMNNWITLRIQTVGTNVNFYADNGSGPQLLQTWPLPAPSDLYYLTFGVGSVCWKSGANDTSFRLITATSN